MKVHFDCINVNQIKMSSGIFVGSNSQNNWSSHQKENSALGTIVGNGNVVHQNINVIHDEDMVDMPIKEETIKKSNGKGYGDA
ncbi:MAG: hypothetical protein WAM07_11505 [Halobacillus sp.]|uniref:hypothetical protein n=1 Tax=Halobacillus sp. TaxID=56800 RepID=UPI003BAE6ED1